MGLGKIHHQTDFAAGRGFQPRAQLAEILKILPVHGQNQVEPAEIAKIDLAGTQHRNVDAPFRRRGNGTRIRRLARMHAAGPGGIDIEALPCLRPHRQMTEHALSGRAAADIAVTDEKHFMTVHRCFPAQPAILQECLPLLIR